MAMTSIRIGIITVALTLPSIIIGCGSKPVPVPAPAPAAPAAQATPPEPPRPRSEHPAAVSRPPDEEGRPAPRGVPIKPSITKVSDLPLDPDTRLPAITPSALQC